MNLCRNLQLQRTLLGLASRCAAARAAGATDVTAGCETSVALRLAAAAVVDIPQTQQWHRNLSKSFAAQAAEEESDSTELTLTDAAVEVRRQDLLSRGYSHNSAVQTPVYPLIASILEQLTFPRVSCSPPATVLLHRNCWEAVSFLFTTTVTSLSAPLCQVHDFEEAAVIYDNALLLVYGIESVVFRQAWRSKPVSSLSEPT